MEIMFIFLFSIIGEIKFTHIYTYMLTYAIISLSKYSINYLFVIYSLVFFKFIFKYML